MLINHELSLQFHLKQSGIKKRAAERNPIFLNLNLTYEKSICLIL